MREGKQAINQITEGVIWKQLLLFFFPILFGTFFQQLYNTVDTVIVGHFVGKEALAAVGGSSTQIVNLIVGFFTGLSSGASVIVAQFFGAKDERLVRQSLHTAYAFSIAGSIVISIIGFIMAPHFLAWMNTPTEIMADSILYLRVYFVGILFVFVYNMGSSVLRAIGDSKSPLIYLILCCFINIVLDIIFVMCFHMGVLGVAVATFISQAFSAILVTYKLTKSKGILKLFIGQIRFHSSVMKSQLRIGVPAGFQTAMYSITNVVIQTALNGFGTETAAAWSVYGKLDAIFWMVSSAFGIAITTFVGQNYGAKKIDRIHKSVRVCLGIDFLVSFFLVIFLVIARVLLFSIFTTDADVIRIGSDMLLQITPWYIVFVVIEVLSGALRGIGDVLIPMILTMCGVCLLRIVWIVFVMHYHPTISYIIFSYPITWIATAVLFFFYYMYRIRRIKL